MFRWYQNAARCYVYLSDVEQGTMGGDSKSAFRQSRWFTRGSFLWLLPSHGPTGDPFSRTHEKSIQDLGI
ncbi:hypothetical protein PSPO01_15262 [Paraphaeosphaeria sporulosa]